MTRIVVVAAALGLCACGGVSEGRVNALEAELAQLREAQQAQNTQSQAQLDAMEESLDGSTARLEQMLGALQAELGKKAAKPAAGAAPKDKATGTSASLVDQARTALGNRAEVNESDDGYAVPREWLETQLEAIRLGAAAGPQLRPNKRGGVTVRGIKVRSPAADLGLRNNDLLISVNGKGVESVDAVFDALATSESSVTVQLQRRKQVIDLTYTLAE